MIAAVLAALAVLAAASALWAGFCGLSAAGELRREANRAAVGSQADKKAMRAKKRRARGKDRAGKLAAAGISADPASWTGTLLALAAVGAAAGLALGGPAVCCALALAAPAAAEFWMRSRAKSRASLFDEQLARALPMVAQSVGAAGVSFERALQAAAENAEEPLKTPLADACAMMRLDGDTVAALEGMARATGSKDLDLVVAAARTHRDSGGDMAQSLSQIAKTIDMRLDMRRTIGTATSSAMSTMKILIVMPVLAVPASIAFFSTARDFYATPAGWAVLAAAAALSVAAFAINKKIANMDEE